MAQRHQRIQGDRSFGSDLRESLTDGGVVKRPASLATVVCTMLVFSACHPRIDLDQEKATLLQTDRDCAAASAAVGFVEAYYRYMADDVRVMPPGESSLSGREVVYATWNEGGGEDRLDWEPQGGSVSQSGDLGWTWGQWAFTTADQEGQGETSYGNYVFVWRKVGSDWKIAANIWNDSPGTE